MKYFIFFFLPVFSFSFSFASDPIPILGSYQSFQQANLFSDIVDYQLGDEWGKVEVSPDLLKTSVVLNRMALATARVAGATGFVLGEFNGDIVVATNHHVCPAGYYYRCERVEFPLLDIKVKRKQFIGTWPEIDLTLLSLEVSPEQRDKLLQVAKNFAFERPLEIDTPLMTSGFGIADNPRQNMVINSDSDCRIVSRTGDVRFMDDPDQVNNLGYKVWSFANACDVSHGDSGSAMVDAHSGDVLGLLWTGKVPKKEEAQSSSQIFDWQSNQANEVWTELSYAVPAQKIQEFLLERINSGELSGAQESLIKELVDTK